jgi:hypothetical protein
MADFKAPADLASTLAALVQANDFLVLLLWNSAGTTIDSNVAPFFLENLANGLRLNVEAPRNLVEVFGLLTLIHLDDLRILGRRDLEVVALLACKYNAFPLQDKSYGLIRDSMLTSQLRYGLS